jgi:predicted nucleic acid-binding protein
MGAGPSKSLALDTNLLLDLASRKDFACEFAEEFLSRGYSLLVPPTVVAELAWFALRSGAPQQEVADMALEKLIKWNCQPFSLSSTDHAIATKFASRLIEAALIPETEQNDGKILAQTSLARIPLLVTSDRHLLDVDENALLLAFNDADLFPVYPTHPRRLVKALR